MMEPLPHEADVSTAGSDPVAPAGSIPPVVVISAAPSSVPAAHRPVAGEGGRFAWLLSSVAFLLVLSFFLPYTVEKMTYAVARGKQRALYDTAGEKLQNVGLNDLSKAYQLVANRVGPSVVHINVTSASVEAAGGLASGPNWQHPPTGQGSGVVVDAEGYVVTNEHVIRGASRIRARLSDGRTVPATVVGIDRADRHGGLETDGRQPDGGRMGRQ